MKKESVEKKVKRLEKLLDRMDRGLYTGVSIGWITDQINWLWKFRYIDYEKMNDLCTHVIDTIQLTHHE